MRAVRCSVLCVCVRVFSLFISLSLSLSLHLSLSSSLSLSLCWCSLLGRGDDLEAMARSVKAVVPSMPMEAIKLDLRKRSACGPSFVCWRGWVKASCRRGGFGAQSKRAASMPPSPTCCGRGTSPGPRLKPRRSSSTPTPGPSSWPSTRTTARGFQGVGHVCIYPSNVGLRRETGRWGGGRPGSAALLRGLQHTHEGGQLDLPFLGPVVEGPLDAGLQPPSVMMQAPCRPARASGTGLKATPLPVGICRHSPKSNPSRRLPCAWQRTAKPTHQRLATAPAWPCQHTQGHPAPPSPR